MNIMIRFFAICFLGFTTTRSSTPQNPLQISNNSPALIATRVHGLLHATSTNLEDILSIIGNDRPLPRWEEACQVTHNNLRYVHGVGHLRWHNLFRSYAEARAIKTLYGDSNNIASPLDFVNQFFQPGEIMYQGAEVNFTLPQEALRDSSRVSTLMSMQVEKILRTWYLNGIFDLPGNSNNYAIMLHPKHEYMGCTVRASVLPGNMVRMYLMIAYYHEQDEDPVMANYLQPKPGLTCKAACSENQQCYAHRNISLHFRITENLVPTYGDHCNCVDTLSDATVPHCFGSCFVHCPLSEVQVNTACYGKSSCRCSKVTNEAICV